MHFLFTEMGFFPQTLAKKWEFFSKSVWGIFSTHLREIFCKNPCSAINSEKCRFLCKNLLWLNRTVSYSVTNKLTKVQAIDISLEASKNLSVFEKFILT